MNSGTCGMQCSFDCAKKESGHCNAGKQKVLDVAHYHMFMALTWYKTLT